MSNRSFHFANRFQTMISAIRAAPLRVLLLAVAVAVVGLMTVADLPSASPVHAQEQAVTATRDATGESPPARPTDLQASAEHDSVSLTWTASTDQTVTHYAVLLRDRDEDDAGVFEVIDSNAGSATSYTDRSVSPEGSYVYRVKAVSPTGVSQWSSYARADIPADPEDLAPSGLSAKFVSGDDGVIEGVALAWDAPAADAESVTGYEILRAVGDGDLATLVAGTGSADTTYADDTATEAGESYAYRVKALRGEEASQLSDRAEVIIPKVTALPVEPGIAEEQSGTTAWVSNTAQTLTNITIVVGNADKRFSQGFTTGAETGGYSLGSVGVHIRDADLESGETLTVHIYTASADGAIDTLVHTLISPDSYEDRAVNLFTAPADATLAANTDYLVVFEATGDAANDFRLSLTNSTSEDSGSATGWSIEDNRRYDDGIETGVLVISVNAAAEESAEVWSATLTVKSYGLGSLGCSNSSTGATCSDNLSDTSFAYGGTTYSISHFFLRAAGTLELAIGTTPNTTTITNLTLNIADSPFPLSTAVRTDHELSWPNSGLTLTADTDVAVSLTEGAAAPAVSSVDVTSEPGDDDTYAIGDTIQVTVTFDQVVTVTGAPRIQLRVGGGEDVHLKWADYRTGTGADAVVFEYVVLAGDFDDNGIYIAADELKLNGGTIQSSDGTDAILDYPLQGGQSGHNVDGVLPTPQFAVTSDDGSSVIIIFSEPLSETTAPASAYTLSVDTGTAPTVSTATATGNFVTLALASALTSDQVVMVAYTKATLGNDAVAVQDAAGNDAVNFTTGAGEVPAVVNAVGTGCSVTDGCYVVPADWGLIPTGLGAGAEFRLIFISSGTRNASSSDIADYNTFVQTAAASGHADIQVFSSTFRVVGSTADVDARDNTATTYTTADKGVAIYWLGGNKVVDDYEDFYDGDWDDEANAKDESGSDRSTSAQNERPFTGSEHDGTKKSFGAILRGLGASEVMLGIPNSGTSGHGPLSSNSSTVNSNTRPFYGLSPVFRVSGQVVAGCGTLPTDRLWSACLTAGAIGSGGPYGYQASDSTGSLAPATFDVGTTTYTVRNLFDNDNIGGQTYVAIVLSPILSEDDAGSLTLHLGDDTSLSFADASYSTGADWSRYAWSRTTALGWSTGDAIVVGITQKEQANTAPAFTTVANFSTNENQTATFQVTAMDPDDGDEVTYAITGGADQAKFDIGATSGVLTFKDAPDHENPTDADSNNVYLVTVTATGGTGDRALTTDQAITVTVTALDEIWSATMTVGVNSTLLGWDDAGNYTGAALSDEDFDYGGDTYNLSVIRLASGSLIVIFNDTGAGDLATNATRDKLTLHVDGATFNFGAGGLNSAQTGVGWTNSGLTWSDGDTVELKITVSEDAEVALTSDPGADDTYAIGDAIEATATFGQAVTVTGTPQIEMQVGGETRTADYASGSGSANLVFSYTVVEGDLDADGVAVEKGLIDLNGGTILVGTTAAGLIHGAVPASTDHKVDGVRPIFVSAETNEAGTRFFLTFSEPISAVNVNAVALSTGTSLTVIEIDGAVVELDPATNFAHGRTLTIHLAFDAVRDLAGNPNSSSSNNPITNNVLAVCGTLPADRLWSACLMVGEIGSGDGRYGYASGSSVGTLVPSSFDIGTTTYTVTNLFANDVVGDIFFRITLAPAISEGDAGSLTLHLGDATLSLGDASYSTGTGISIHEWSLFSVLGWSEGDAIVVGISQANTDPSFLLESATREVAENSAAGVDVGGPVTATDTDTGDTLTYTLEGTDAASFNIDASSGQIQTETGVTYDHELQPEYSVTVKADDGNGGTDTIAVTIDIADVDEPPSAPAAPTVSAVSGTTDSLEVTWTAPDNAGKPDIESYDLQYRQGTTGNWIDGPQDETGTSATIGGLDEDSAYQVQVRATNDEGDGAWSSPGSGSTNAPAKQMAETTVPADWSLIPGDLGPGDSFRLIFIGTSNTNASSSDIDVYNTFVQDLVAASGHEDIKALSGTFRMLGSTEAVDARDNTATTGAGVAIYWLGGAKVADDYADFYDGDWDEEATGRRENGDSVSIGNNWKIWTGSAEDGTEAMSTGATPTSRALGNSNNAWVMQGSPNGSDSAHGPIESDTTDRGNNRYVYGLSGVFTVSDQAIANNPPAFSSAASFSVAENRTDAGTVMAADPDAVDAVTYAVTGGADEAKFDIGASSGVLTFKDAPDHENPTDAGGNNTYLVTVTATGGTGDRAKTAEQSITVTVTDVAETPAVDDLDVSSTPKADIDTYGREETIEVTVTFDQAVNVTGTPRIRLRIGGGMQEHYRWANYDGGTGTTALRFTYVVVEGDMDTDGIYILENELELNEGAILGVDDDADANLDYARQGTQSGHKVDGSLKSDNTDPVFDQESAVRGLRENTGAGEHVGDPFTATDEDGDTLTYSLEGDDAGSFVINSRTGQILTREGVTYDHEVTTEYSVTVKADDGERGDATVEVAILVIDVNEPPLAPRAPTLSDGPDDSGSLDVTWKTPDNSGRPDIESYDLRYRKTGAENWRNGPQDVTGLTATIGGLDADSDYQVQVRATNDEGDGEWSPSRSTTYPTGPVIEVDDNGDGVVDADPEVTLVLGSTVSYRVRPGRCEGYKTLTVQRMSGASEGAPPHIPVDASQEVSPMPCMGEDDPGEWQTVTLAVPLDLWLELLLETPFEASVEHSVYYRRSLTDRYSPLLLWGHLVRVLAPAPETLNPVGSLTVAPEARDYPRVTWSAVPGATDYQVQWRWGPDEKYGRVHSQEGSIYKREKRTGETAYTIPISETVPTTDEGVERSQPITVRVRPYDSKGLAVGPWREALLAERTEVRKVLAGFSLLDADGSSLAALTDGATVELSDPDGGSYAIRAELVAGELAGSVHLELSGKKRVRSTENDAPYLLAGGEGMALPAGSYTLKATAYGGPNRTYAVQDTLEVSFTVRASGEPGSGELNVEEDEEEETEPLTARFEGLPEAGHGGAGTPFAFQLVFSEAVSTTPEALRDHALAVTNATVEAASRVDGRSDLWEVRLTPESDAMVTVSLSPAADCDAAGAVCTEDGRMLSVGAARVIPGPPPNSPATGQPTISGTAQVGQTLTADTTGIADEDGLDNVTFSYQWMADDANIQGATGSTYTLADRDKGKTIKVIVSFTDDANNEESLPSAATDAVTALPGKPQSLAGKATTQEIQLAWKAPTGPAVVEYVVYRGILQNGSMNGQALSKYATIDAAGKAMTYTDGNVEEGVEYRYRVAAVNADGEGKKSNWLDITAE